jgi:hypothetical protein
MTGVEYETAVPVVWNMLQPPFSTGSRLVRRCKTEPQSISCKSTFMPILRRASAVTTPRGPMTGKSVGLTMTTRLPAYPASPFCNAADAVAGSGTIFHSTRGKCATLPPEAQSGGSEWGM